jgi:O-methyltransferase involved in polyketide biosynthesis
MAHDERPAELTGAAAPNIARIYDYLLGGQNNSAADREVAQALIELSPGSRATAVENRRFLGRAVRYLVQQGIRQFLDIGAGLPTQDNVHQIAQRAAPGARIVYADVDPDVVSQARALLPADGSVAIIQGDLREPGQILRHPEVQRLLDFRQPVALLLAGVLYFVPDSEDPYGAVRQLRGALAPGSYLVLSHATADLTPAGKIAEGARIYSPASAGLTFRSRAQIEGFLTGLDLVEPGLVVMSQWRPDSGQPVPDQPAGFGAVGRLPAR